MNEPKMIVVRGKPAPQGSKVSTRYGGMREASQFVMPWRNQIVSACIEQKINNGEIIEQPVEIFIDFLFYRPQGHYGTGRNERNLKPSAPTFPTTRTTGDIDKLCRSTLDGLSVPSGGILLKDDSLVVELKAKKTYAARGGFQGAFIHIWKL
jgi:Holliday junction resolvase RusA-like endonuclease